MPAAINYVETADEARFRLEHAEAGAVGLVSAAISGRIAVLAAHLPPGATVHVMTNWEQCCVAVVEDEAGGAVFDELLALTDDGRIAFGGINQPLFYNTVADLLASRR